jgi:hypothetical protein
MDEDLLPQKNLKDKSLKELLYEVAESESEIREIDEVFGPSAIDMGKGLKISRFDN